MAVYFGYGNASCSAFRGTTYAMAAILVTLTLQSAAQERAIDGSQDDPSNLVVVIERRLGETEGLGAGLISGYKDDMVYIATANHTVRWGREQAAEIEILFKRVPERRVRASLLERFDTSLDLAVLAVRSEIQIFSIPRVSHKRLRATRSLYLEVRRFIQLDIRTGNCGGRMLSQTDSLMSLGM